MLKLLYITKEYRIDDADITLALKDVSIEFRQNEFVSILGPSGCGKTTLLNIVGGLDRYTSGDIQIDGVSTKKYDDVDWDTYRNQRIGFVFQSYNLIPHMNILKNVALCLTLAGVSREERTERAMEALRKVGLDGQAKKKPNQLSGGQMQRVAIARALVNNPDIILADEPTGALDTESGLQVMELLKEVASDRLVIMVTHNPQLAEDYSTRIVYLKDGEVVDDTMPYDSQAEEKAEVPAKEEALAVEESAETVVEAPAKEEAPTKEKKCSLKDKIAELSHKIAKRKKLDKSAMKLSTAIALSWNNLISKKGRTFLTSIAGSIGIIGIILVLALSTGASMFIKSLEEDALSTYPLSVDKSSLGITDIMSKLMGGSGDCGDSKHVDADNDGYIDTDKNKDHFCDKCNKDLENMYDVDIDKVLGAIMDTFLDSTAENDLHSFKAYIDEHFDDALATVKYDYGTTFNVYAKDPASTERYMKVNPYTEAMYIVLDEMANDPTLGGLISTIKINGMSVNEALSMFATMLGNSWAEMSTNQELLDSQYDVVAGAWPKAQDEIVIVLTSSGKLIDFQMFMLGLKSQDDVIDALLKGSSFSATGFNFDQLIGKEYMVMTNADYLVENEKANPDDPTTWSHLSKSTLDKELIDGQNPYTVKVVGVVQPKPDAVASSIGGVVGYTKQLGDYLLNRASNHEGAKAQQAAYDAALEAGDASYKSVLSYTIVNGDTTKEIKVGSSVNIKNSSDNHDDIMRALGVANPEYPESILFYCSSFDSKDAVVEFIAGYNRMLDSEIAEIRDGRIDSELTDEERAEIKAIQAKQIDFTDTLSTVMGFVNVMTDVITGVLVAFAAISLVVSTIMIAIIIYTSVLERRKEIGVLRSIGARKKDVARVFLAESAILGGYSGIIGVVVACLIALGGSALLEKLFGIPGIMTVEWWQVLMMLGISVVLSMLAGFIPSRIAAKKDPAIALRSE